MSDSVDTVETEDSGGMKLNPRHQLRRVIQGDLSSLRVVFGLIVIAIIFQVQESRFLSAENLTNLMLQITTIGLISVGIVYVLLLGEIDLSVGAVSG
ncbi:MAG: sugar ABC transporter permease, partial [Actinobacteria bacterium]|nr:sugar ABC transporter permease [Actinomycetota bacterium]